MIGGLSVSAVIGVLLSLGLAMMPDISDQAPLFVATLVAGGAGAVMSVLYAMTSGNLRLHTLFANAESGLGPLVAAGALRPLLGALSGTVVYVLLQSGLVPLKVPDGAAADPLLHRAGDRRRVQRAVGARRAGRHRRADPVAPRKKA